uniref:CCHC-type domain-containing protein n=1 Tax=Tanacetum cinerariifolium TaxID=118510 RepID=A0A6L2KP57_TANCI|nr:hypothetical protein [Tanacetum cinerariifolium]
MAAGSRDRPPMLAPGRYPQWLHAIEATDNSPAVAEHTTLETPSNMSPENKAHFLAKKEAIHLILTGIGDDIYSTDVKTNLFWEFGKFTLHDGESMESYYTRFYKLMNEMIRNNLTVTTMQVNVQFLQQLQPEWSRFVKIVKQQHKLDEVSYHKLFDIMKQYQNEVNELRAKKLARNANPLALVATAQASQDPLYQSSRHKGNEIAKLLTPPSDTASEEDNDPEQAQRDKDMQKNLALIAKYFKKIYRPTTNNLKTSSNSKNKNVDTTLRYKNDDHSGQFGNQRTVNVVVARDKVGSTVVQKYGIQCFNCKEYGHFAKECRKPKRVKDSAYHKEKMLLCKQAEQGVPLPAEQYDWLADTDEEVDEQELEAHYSYMAKIQEVPNADSGTDSKPVEQVQNNAKYNVFANRLQHSEQSEYVINTCLVEADDSNTTPNSPDMCEDDIQNEQNDVESDDERVALANLIANLKLDSLGESISARDSCLVALQTKQTEFEKYKAFNDRTADYDKLEHLFCAPTAQDMEILIQTCLMPLAIKTQGDSLKFVHELKQEMHADLKYVESLEKEIDELESEKAEFSNMYDVILQDCVSKDVMCSYLQSLSDLDALAELQCMYLHKVKECDCLAQKLSKQTEFVSKKEREQYFKIQDLKARMKDKNISISELKKLIEKGKGKSVDTKFDRPSVVRQPNAQRISKPSVLGKLTPFSNFVDRIYFQKAKSVPKANVLEGLSKPVTAQTLHQATKKAIVQLILFIIDSGCTKHMTGNLKLLCNFVEKFLGSLHVLLEIFRVTIYSSTIVDLVSTLLYLTDKVTPTQAWLWHRRLSHLNFDYINQLLKKDIVIGLPKLKYVKDQLCSSCDLSKAKRSSFKSKAVPSSKGRRTRMIVESIHIRFDEIKEVSETSVANNSSGLVLQREKALDYDNPDPVPSRQDVSSSADAASTSAPSTHINVHAEENNNDQAEEGEQLQDDEFTNPFCASTQEEAESSSHNIGNINVPTLNQPQVSKYRWTKDHPLEQVRGNPSRPVQIRRQLATDLEMCMYALTEEVYVAQPDGFIDPDHPEKVYRLRKALYGLKQAPRAWYDELSKFLISKGFTKGLQIHQSPSGIFINQAKYTLEILHKHGMDKGQSIGDKLVSWMSKKYNCTAMSSAEAEYVALSHSRTKHIQTRYHFIKEQVKNGIIELYFVRTEYQLADMFTKALPEDRFKYLVMRIVMRCLTPAELEFLVKESP